jgi:hypothetical protein
MTTGRFLLTVTDHQGFEYHGGYSDDIANLPWDALEGRVGWSVYDGQDCLWFDFDGYDKSY